MRPVAPDPEILAWLWSHEGILWHQKTIKRVRHGAGHFAEVKKDHECSDGYNCTIGGSPYADERILADIRCYGLSGVPGEWKMRLPCSEQQRAAGPQTLRVTMTDSFISPTVHHAQSAEDAIVMLDSRMPLTHQERKLIVESLYDLAFREGARQGRQAGIESVHAEIRTLIHEYRDQPTDDRMFAFKRSDIAGLLETLLPPSSPREYSDTTQVIREKLAAKARQRVNGS